MRTSVHGRIEGDAVVGGIALRGSAIHAHAGRSLSSPGRSPTKASAVDRVIVDASYFDDQIRRPRSNNN
jgi:hypothetical protein